MKNFTKILIKGVISGWIIGLASGFVVVKFVAPAFNLEGDWGTITVAIASAIGAIVIIELDKHSKEKAK